MPEKEVVLEDWAIVAYLTLKGLKVTPFKKSDGRVAFLVDGDVESAVGDIYSNKKVGINDYIKALRSVRGAIFTLRTLNKSPKD